VKFISERGLASRDNVHTHWTA